jgi:hypothetical protein
VERVHLTSERAETIINLLRDNPGVSMTTGDIADATDIPVDELAAHLEELVDHEHIVKETTVDGYDTFYFPAERQRGSTTPEP